MTFDTGTNVSIGIPMISFSTDASYDTLVSVLRGWTVQVEIGGGVRLYGEFKDEETFLQWDEETCTSHIETPMAIDTIVHITVL